MDGVEGLEELDDSQSEMEVDGEDVTEGSVVQYVEETSEDVVQVAESDTEEEGSSDSQMTMTVDEQEWEEGAAPEGNAGQMAWMLGLHPEGGNADTATGNITALNNYCGEILLRGKISAVFLRKN